MDRAGFEVRFADPRATKRPDGRKADLLVFQWIRQLMSMGLLSGAYRTPHAFCAFRSYVRQLALWEVAGVDLSAITGVRLESALLIVLELGTDVSAFPSAKHFCSWLVLAPNNQISGGNVQRKFRPRKGNRLGQAFRQCAVTIRRSEFWLGAKLRRRLKRMEKARAVKATAHEIARLVCAMLRDGTEYVERSIADFEKEYQDRKIAHIGRQAHAVGCQLVPIHSASTG